MATNQTANDTLALVIEAYKHEPVSITSTEGVYATQAFLQAQINALADYIDGKRTVVTVTPAKVSAPVTAKSGKSMPSHA